MIGLRSKSPSGSRLFVALLVMLAASPVAAQQAALTADDVVRLVLGLSSTAELEAARLAEVRHEMEEQTVHPVPSLGLAHEQILGYDDVSSLEFTATVEQQLDLTDWRGRLREAQRPRAAAVTASIDQRELETATAVQTAFFAVRHREERVAVLAWWIARLDSGLESVSAREARGDASTLEVRRVERAKDIARAQLATESSLMAEAWATLDSWAGWDTRPELSGVLVPSGSGERPRVEPPNLARLSQLSSALEAEAAAWRNPFLRGWVLGAGYRLADSPAGTGHGFTLSLSIPLALWNVDEARVERIESERSAVELELDYLRAQATRSQEAARDRLRRVLQALDTLPDSAVDGELTRLAETAFAADEASLTELLGAIESEADLRLTRIDLEWEARRAALDLNHELGIGVPR